MICEVCLGMGTVLRRSFPSGEEVPRPCPECAGSGITHCCEGIRPDNVAPAPAHPMFSVACRCTCGQSPARRCPCWVYCPCLDDPSDDVDFVRHLLAATIHARAA